MRTQHSAVPELWAILQAFKNITSVAGKSKPNKFMAIMSLELVSDISIHSIHVCLCSSLKIILEWTSYC